MNTKNTPLASLKSQINAILEFNGHNNKWNIIVPAFNITEQSAMFENCSKLEKITTIVDLNKKVNDYFNSPEHEREIYDNIVKCSVYIVTLFHLGDKRVTVKSIDERAKTPYSHKLDKNTAIFYALFQI